MMVKKILIDVGSKKIEVLNPKSSIIKIPDYAFFQRLRIVNSEGISILSYNLPHLEISNKILSADLRAGSAMGLTESTILSVTKNSPKYDFILVSPAGFDISGIKKFVKSCADLPNIIMLMDSKTYHQVFSDNSISVMHMSDISINENKIFKVIK